MLGLLAGAAGAGGGGFSNQTSSATGDQTTGAITFGNFGAVQDGNNLQKYLIPAALVLVGLYIITNKRR